MTQHCVAILSKIILPAFWQCKRRPPPSHPCPLGRGERLLPHGEAEQRTCSYFLFNWLLDKGATMWHFHINGLKF